MSPRERDRGKRWLDLLAKICKQRLAFKDVVQKGLVAKSKHFDLPHKLICTDRHETNEIP